MPGGHKSSAGQLNLTFSVVSRHALDPSGQQIARGRTAEVAQTKNADHPFALVDHSQSAHLKLLHVPHCLGEVIIIPTAMDARRHHIARRREASVETVLRQSFADDVTVGHHADQPVILSNRNGAYVMLTHQFRELGDRRLWTDPVDALVHCVLDFHGGPPLLKFAYQPRFPRLPDYTTDRILSHGLKAHRAHMLA